MTTATSLACNGCEVLPLQAPTGGVLYLTPPLGHTLAVIKRVVHEMKLSASHPAEGTLAVTVTAPDLSRLMAALSDALTESELQATNTLKIAPDIAPGIREFVRSKSLAWFVAQDDGRWLAGLIAEKRLVTHVQPIVHSYTPDIVFAWECLTRGVNPDGSLIPPYRLFQTAIRAGLLYQLDRATRMLAIRNAAAYGLDGRIFVNFTPSSIYNPAFCLRSTIQAAQEAEITPDRVVFEVVESDEIRDTGHLVSVLDVYRNAGFKVALDDLGAGYGSLGLLRELRPDFVKLDMGLTTGVDSDSVRATIASKLLEVADALQIPSIAEGVETTAEWEWLRDHGATYQQGYLFAKPGVPPFSHRVPQPAEPALA